MLQIDKNKIKTIRLNFPLHRDSLSSYLSPLIGQYAIKNTEFIQEFVDNFNRSTNNLFRELINIDNTVTGGSLYAETLYIPISLAVYKGGKFTMQIMLPSLGFIFSAMFKKRRRLYKRFTKNSEFIGFRNYKKLFQITLFKGAEAQNSIYNYRNIRNALYQKK